MSYFPNFSVVPHAFRPPSLLPPIRYQITGQSKLPESLNYLEDLLDKGTKALVFAHHRGILDAIADKLSKKKIRHIRIDGGTVQSGCLGLES